VQWFTSCADTRNVFSSSLAADQRLVAATNQFQGLSRGLQQLQIGFQNLSQLESHLRGELAALGGSDVTSSAASQLPALPPAEPGTSAAAAGRRRDAAALKPAAAGARPAAATTAEGPPHAVDSLAEREIKIFLSSPFRDMMEERDLMVKRIIPKLKKLCMCPRVILNMLIRPRHRARCCAHLRRPALVGFSCSYPS
jgi:hypothetical protein